MPSKKFAKAFDHEQCVQFPHIYSGTGKKPRDHEQNSYPPISHDRMPDEVEFAQTFQDAHENLECWQRERNRGRNNVETEPSGPIEK